MCGLTLENSIEDLEIPRSFVHSKIDIENKRGSQKLVFDIMPENTVGIECAMAAPLGVRGYEGPGGVGGASRRLKKEFMMSGKIKK